MYVVSNTNNTRSPVKSCYIACLIINSMTIYISISFLLRASWQWFFTLSWGAIL